MTFVDDNVALIGGIVGGVFGLLVVGGGLIAILVACNRRHKKQESNDNNDEAAAAALQPVRQVESQSNYGVIDPQPPQNYDAWDDNYIKPSMNHRTNYEDFTQVQ
jgi:hypothetical protein